MIEYPPSPDRKVREEKCPLRVEFIPGGFVIDVEVKKTIQDTAEADKSVFYETFIRRGEGKNLRELFVFSYDRLVFAPNDLTSEEKSLFEKLSSKNLNAVYELFQTGEVSEKEVYALLFRESELFALL